MERRIAAAVIGLTLGLSATAANADAIDGDWCAEDGRHLSIQGPKLVTPRGTETAGNYRRHSFDYVVPAADPGAGTEIALVLIHDDLMHGTRPGVDGVETWRRCRFTS